MPRVYRSCAKMDNPSIGPQIGHFFIYIYIYICQRPFNSATWLFIAPRAAADSSAAPGNFRPGPPEHTATPERPCTRRAGVGQERRPIPYKSFQKINANRPGRQAENAVPNRPCRRLAILRLGTGCRVKKNDFGFVRLQFVTFSKDSLLDVFLAAKMLLCFPAYLRCFFMSRTGDFLGHDQNGHLRNASSGAVRPKSP